MMRPFRSLLVANRGEIAVRVFRTARALGLRTVAVYSDADADAVHVHEADVAVRIGPGAAEASYLSIEAVVEAAKRAGADAVHPGYGFLAENAIFARACGDAGLVFVGPTPEAIEAMGDKARAKAIMREAGVPCVPGYDEDDRDEVTLARAATEIGYPLLIKASAGGGGRGMRRVDDPGAFAAALASARAEARAAFGDDRVLLERLVENARHVEVQVFGDSHGNVIHLGERDCSAQRRHQKVIEESPSPAVDAALREAMGRTAVEAARAIGYVGAGTIEFLLEASGSFYFLEMNTRLQVEHPVTEAVTGHDLVAWQLQIAAGEPLLVRQDQVLLRGHAIEARLYAEDPHAGFAPRPGRLLLWQAPRGEGVRCDAGVDSGREVPALYDPMLAKVIAHGSTREQARRRLRRALLETACLGLTTNRQWLLGLIEHPRFVDGAMTTGAVEAELELPPPSRTPALVALAAVVHAWGPACVRPDPWRNSGSAAYPIDLALDGQPLTLTIDPGRDASHEVRFGEHAVSVGPLRVNPPEVRACIDGVEHRALVVWEGARAHLQLDAACVTAEEIIARGSAVDDVQDSEIRAPSAGRVIAVTVAPGSPVAAGDVAVKLEAMKIESSLVCTIGGRVAEVRVQPGDQVPAGQLLVRIDPSPSVQEQET